jgi:Pyruvate/2-oxoacid:ferredoxin oxidoreductase gamma subunit
MPDLASFLQMLQAGGNAAMIGLFFVMWKFDRRLVAIETSMKFHLKDEEYLHALVDRRLNSVKVN